MDQRLFTNSHIIAWLQYYAENTQVDLEKVKLLKDMIDRGINASAGMLILSPKRVCGVAADGDFPVTGSAYVGTQ